MASAAAASAFNYGKVKKYPQNIFRSMSRRSHSSRRHFFAAASDVKIIFIGDHNCGKSGLLTSFSKIDNNDSEVFIPKNCDFNVLNTTSVDDSNNGKKKNISIWESISSPDHDFYFGTDFILLCFNINDIENAFKNIIEIWIPEAEHFCPNAPIILIGCKNDFCSEENIINLNINEKTVIHLDDGAEMAKKINAIGYVEFSSIEIEEIQEIYNRVIKLAMESNSIHKKKTKTSNTICNCVIM